ncbi:site-specific integrase [Sporosarcina sp. Marseille-Q4063]|uniref:tyrosine-type recombinase/integrase n=1 Tax=Sporosarcina sp. Marseille-Q4063 TaxID=2810514 RepID=UPI001BAF6F6E|nr:tyrosine-type recombinase/integrase [Sporosarcina sp. Marseille-Q4063]QUW20879.1 site-specific integrase [Sporosarcina sp. Marseille-Q4063]
MASFIKRGKSWQYTVSHYVNGKLKPIRKGGFRTKKEAQVAAMEVETKLNKGIKVAIKPKPFNIYFEKWISLYKSNLDSTTQYHYKNTLNIISSYFNDIPIQEIEKSDYQLFLNKVGENRAKETMKKINSQIRACVLEAIDEEIIHRDFTRNIVLTGNDGKPVEEKFLHWGESEILLDVLLKNLDNSVVYYVILLALTSGMRFGEMIGLTRNDFDFKNNTIKINKTRRYLPTSDAEIKKTKTKESNRIIKMDNRTMSEFKKMFAKTPDNIYQLVFYSPASKYKVISNTAVNKSLKKLLISLKIEPVSIHGMRHTHASILLYKGISIHYVSERLGHADVDTTIRVYSHMIKELRERDEKKMLEVFAQI